jgi:FHS family Na+ dependent glucose MFS transporter 1
LSTPDSLPSELSSRGKLPIAVAFYAAVLLEGLMLAAPGPTLDALASQTDSTLGQIGIVFTANGLGFVTGALLGGRLYSRMAGSRLLAYALGLMAIATFTLPWLGSLTLVVASFVVIGLAIGLVDVGGNTLIVWLYRQDVPPYMNALHLFWGIGAFLAPLLIAQVDVVTGEAVAAYWLFAAAMVPVAIWVASAPSPDAPPDAGGESGGLVLRRHSFFVALMAILFFIHVGAELSFGGWIFSYAEALGIGPDTTARVLNSVFWGGLVIGRLLAIPISLRVTPKSMIQIDLLGAALGLGVIGFLSDWAPSLWIGTALFGISIASIFASCINYTERHMPVTSQVTAIFLVGASLGSMSLPWLTGRLFDARGPEAMLYVVGVTILVGYVVFASLRVHVSRGRRDSPRPAGR